MIWYNKLHRRESKMAEEKYVLKDELFNVDTVKKLSSCIKSVYSPFEENNFFDEIIKEMVTLELKERVTLIRLKLEYYLPNDFIESTNILLKSLQHIPDSGDFVFASYSEYVEFNGCNEKYLELSLKMLGEYTKWFSAEFVIRRFINTFPEITYNKMLMWSLSDDHDQRRLASEGLRPKLPWAKKIDFDYKLGVKPLDHLYYDDERYVVRSVANHLNDVSKIDPDFVVELLKKWRMTDKQTQKEMDYLINHSLRTSVKKGHVGSLALLGYHQDPEIVVENLTILNSDIIIGDSLQFKFDILSMAEEQLMIDFKVRYPMANGKTSDKVFKIKKLKLSKNQRVTISKKHAFKVMTTKRLYSGSYLLMIQINGKTYSEHVFTIKV